MEYRRIYCMNCGMENREDSNFCINCGAKIIPLEFERPGSDHKHKKHFKKKILILSAVVTALLIMSIVLVIVLRNKNQEAVDATKRFLHSYSRADLDSIMDQIPDGVLSQYYSWNQDLYSDYGINSAKELKRITKLMLQERMSYKIGMMMESYTIGKSQKVDRAELEDYLKKEALQEGSDWSELSDFLSVFNVADEFVIVDMTISVTKEDELEEEKGKDICYKYKGKWYSASCLSLLVIMDSYLSRCARADDVSTAGVISTALASALANEDTYLEISDAYKNGNLLYIYIYPGDTPEIKTSVDAPAVIREMKENLKQEKTVKSVFNGTEFKDVYGTGIPLHYRKKGASMYTAVYDYESDGPWGSEVTVYIGTDENPTAWQIVPNLDREYK